jgi:hypothetical protein
MISAISSCSVIATSCGKQGGGEEAKECGDRGVAEH